ncbi:vegetative cell wall protein gp1-like isoform X2 [Zingiber officinale]|uniref:Uncharacterized protein n=1 Tax=Zingiber officinale TaxID=94328 RepID=A0A8J5GZY1_ZINOF|nr:vegetative cell wall protein gp1-like isoform X2 [Zingiber officinale]KAG6517149.1 hypothetical protein ZIOFF_020529 [Zingiber officinale]
MASQLPPSGRPWLLRLASQAGRADPQAEASSPPQPTAPQQAPRPVGLPIRQASLALGRSPLVPPAAATQPSQPPPVATQPAPLRPFTLATNGSAVVTPRQSPTPPLAMARRSPPPPSPKVVTPEPAPPKTVPEIQVKRTVEEQQPKKNGTAVEGIKNGGNGNLIPPPPPPPSINSAAADQKEEKKYSPASGKGWAMPTSAAATAANKQGARDHMGGITIAGYNVGAFMDLGTSSSSFSHQIRRQQVRSMKNEYSDAEDATKTEGKTKKPWPSMVNNNVQSVNNSLVFGTRLVQGSPGVHVNLTKNRK